MMTLLICLMGLITGYAVTTYLIDFKHRMHNAAVRREHNQWIQQGMLTRSSNNIKEID